MFVHHSPFLYSPFDKELNISSNRKKNPVMFGLGYDDLNEDYKVLIVFCKSDGATEANVYSLKKNSFSQIREFKGGIPLTHSGWYASGNLHRAAWHGVDNWKIVSLDLANDTLGEMERPHSKEVVKIWTIGVLGGCLSVLYAHERNGVDLWVMKEYGVKGSWTKLFSVPHADYPSPWNRLFFTVCPLRSGEVVLVLSAMLVLYYPKCNTCRWYPQMNELEDVTMFVESLVSPDLHDEESRQL